MQKLLESRAGVAAVSLLGLASLSSPVFAAIDTTGALASVADAVTAISAVGGALIGAAAIVMALRWVKAMFF